MANITIDDLTESSELDRHAMKTFVGGLGLARSLLFTMGEPRSRAAGGSGGGVNNFINQFFVDTIQLNVLDQDINIIDSDNANVSQNANAENFNSRILAENPLANAIPSL